MRPFCHLAVIEKVRDDDTFQTGRRNQGVHLGQLARSHDSGTQYPLGLVEGEYLRSRYLRGPLAYLDIDEVILFKRGLLEILVQILKKDTLRVYESNGIRYVLPGIGMLAELRRSHLSLRFISNSRVKSEIRDYISFSSFPLLHKLRISLEDRKIELSDQRLVHPRRSLPVVVVELRTTRHQKHQKQEEYDQRQIDPEAFREIDFLHITAIIFSYSAT